MKIGYARVSKDHQCLDLQLKALEAAGCEVVYSDHGISGATLSRPGLDRALRRLRPGDMLVVWKLDRLGRSLRGLVKTVDLLGKKDVQFASLSESLDTSTPGGTLLFHLMAAMAQFERSLLSERTRAGLSAARERGSRLGRPRLLGMETMQAILCQIQAGSTDIQTVARQYGVHPRTIQRYLKDASISVVTADAERP